MLSVCISNDDTQKTKEITSLKCSFVVLRRNSSFYCTFVKGMSTTNNLFGFINMMSELVNLYMNCSVNNPTDQECSHKNGMVNNLIVLQQRNQPPPGGEP